MEIYCQNEQNRWYFIYCFQISPLRSDIKIANNINPLLNRHFGKPGVQFWWWKLVIVPPVIMGLNNRIFGSLRVRFWWWKMFPVAVERREYNCWFQVWKIVQFQIHEYFDAEVRVFLKKIDKVDFASASNSKGFHLSNGILDQLHGNVISQDNLKSRRIIYVSIVSGL